MNIRFTDRGHLHNTSYALLRTISVILFSYHKFPSIYDSHFDDVPQSYCQSLSVGSCLASTWKPGVLLFGLSTQVNDHVGSWFSKEQMTLGRKDFALLTNCKIHRFYTDCPTIPAKCTRSLLSLVLFARVIPCHFRTSRTHT